MTRSVSTGQRGRWGGRVTPASEFFDAANTRKNLYAGSGTVEWGKHLDVAGYWVVNQGLWGIGAASYENQIRWGRPVGALEGGTSRTEGAVLNINGIELALSHITSTTVQSSILFPTAPDGLDKPDGTRTPTYEEGNIINRQDFVFLEMWHELVEDKDVVYPLGNVQCGATTWDGITLSSALVAQGYSAFGDWDTTTIGYGVKWSTLSDDDQDKFLQDSSNNIYLEGNKLVQVRYRVRTFKGFEGDWSNGTDGASAESRYLRNGFSFYVAPQGSLDTTTSWNITYPVFANNGHSNDGNDKLVANVDTGLFGAVNDNTGAPTAFGYKGQCFAIPIALVQRLNQGAYHPSYNHLGTSQVSSPTHPNEFWWSAQALATIFSTADCMDPTKNNNGGAISVNRSGRVDGQFYDAIYDAYVDDKRMSARVKAPEEVLEEYKSKAISNQVRGFEKTPFARAYGSSLGISDNSPTLAIFLLSQVLGDTSQWASGTWYEGSGWVINTTTGNTDRVSRIRVEGTRFWAETGTAGTAGDICHFVVGDMQPSRASEHTWTDIIGDPARIAATFPNGVIGEWIPVIPDGSSKEWPLNRKSLTNPVTQTYTSDDGATWGQNTRSIIDTTNSWTGALAAIDVRLWQYTTPSHFVDFVPNGEILTIGETYAVCYHDPNVFGGLVVSNLLDKVATGSSKGEDNVEGIRNYGIYLNKFSTTASYAPTHDAVNISHNNSTPAVKFLDYMSHSNGIYQFNMAFKELIFDTTWGDDNTFPIYDNRRTYTDTNGNIGLAGTAMLKTPYFNTEHLRS